MIGFPVGTTTLAPITQSINSVSMTVEQTIVIHSDICLHGLLGIYIDLVIGQGTISWSSNDILHDSKILVSEQSTVNTFRITNEDDTVLDTHGQDINILLYFYHSDDI